MLGPYCRAQHCNRSLNEAVRVGAHPEKTSLPTRQVVTALAFVELAILHDCRREVGHIGHRLWNDLAPI